MFCNYIKSQELINNKQGSESAFERRSVWRNFCMSGLEASWKVESEAEPEFRRIKNIYTGFIDQSRDIRYHQRKYARNYRKRDGEFNSELRGKTTVDSGVESFGVK